ncbi:hypothetical protein [Solidesulfovibrio sp.]|uniref:hypothetical protein n=1 Tax=Solidesulfovibrio sp. TaxID=2910990 RepID=UPI002608E5A5|nr:hypothetical protein [Solidesulfovibrio sp.]
MEERSVSVTFAGGAMASLGYALLCLVLSICIIPAAWGAVAFFGWWCAGLRFSDGSRAVFEGRAGKMWPLFAVAAFLAVLPNLATAGLGHGNKAGAVQIVLAVALIPLDAAVKLALYRWLIENIRLTPGGSARFGGRYAPFLGWVLLFTASIVTVVGWAFVATAMTRWLCRNIEAEGFGVEFTGSGLGLLGHTILWLVGFTLLLPIPWVLRSMLRWWTRGFAVIRREPAMATFP